VTGEIETKLRSQYKFDTNQLQTSSQDCEIVVSGVEYKVVEEKGGCVLDANLELSGFLYSFGILAQNIVQDDFQEDLQNPDLLQCLPILLRGSRMDGIVLRRWEGSENNVFRRVGYFWNDLAMDFFVPCSLRLEKHRIILV